MVQSELSSISYIGNESTVVPYPIPFPFRVDEDLVVSTVDAAGTQTPLALNTDYIVTGKGNPNGGSLKTTVAVPVTNKLVIERVVPITQLVSYQEGDAFPAKSHEGALDKLTEICQQIQRIVGTGTGLPSDVGSAFRLTSASGGINAIARKNDAVVGIDATGNAVLRTAGEMLGWLGQVGTVWQDTPERLVTRGAYAGQLGVQLDNGTIYIANSDTPGDWFPFLIGTGIVAATDGVPHLLAPPAGDLVGTEESQVLYNKTLESPTINNPTGLDKGDVGLGNVDNTSDLNKPLSSATGAALAFKQDKAEKGFSNGYASLDGGGKVPISQIPDSVIGASQYQGTWNAATNTPTIPAAAIGNKGWYYSVAVAGTTNIDGINSWAVGDQIISNGAIWQKIVNVSAVQSVNGKTGTVVINKADVGLANVDNTSDAAKDAAATTLTNKTIRGVDQVLMQVRLDVDVVNNLPVNRLNNGTGAAGNTWWCGDGSWKQPPGTGDVNGPPGSADGELCLYSGTTGKLIRRFSGAAGFAKAGTTGLLTTQAKILAADVDKDVVTSAPRITIPEWNDLLWISETSDTGLLKSITYHDAHPLPRNWLAGMTLANNVADTANDIDLTPGEARSDDNLGNIVLSAPLTKRLDAAWAAGTGQGGRDTGVIADGGWHLYAIRNPTTNVSDVLFSQSFGSPTMPSGFTQKRRIGWVLRSGAGGIIPFTQVGDYFQYPTPRNDVAALNHTPSQFGSYPLISVPFGLKIQCHVMVRASNSAGASQVEIRDNDVAGSGIQTLYITSASTPFGYVTTLWCDNQRRILIYTQNAPASSTTTHYVSVHGYWDHRGKQD